jgi:hypothetical protein
MTFDDHPESRALACQTCGGLGYAEPAEGDGLPVHCPMCGAPMKGTTAYDVRWDSSEKQFTVALEFPTPQHPAASQQIAKRLPGFIAEHSHCSCGSRLVPGDHNLSIKGRRASFQGAFRCPRCGDLGVGALATIRRSLATIWRQIIRIKVGPTGVELEKSGQKGK